MTEQDLREEINKRLTLNWLIQGTALHVGMTSHHLVRDELNALDPRLMHLYDQFAAVSLLQYWRDDAVIFFGWPGWFWRRAASRPSHPFFAHPLLSRFGGVLAAAARRRAWLRCKEKGVISLPLLFSCQVRYLIGRLRVLEAPHRPRLIELAKRAASAVWGIPEDRLDGVIASRVSLGNASPARTFRGMVLRATVLGYSCVERRGNSLIVVGRGTNWPVLAHELVKGTAELICLHGLNNLSDNIYRCVREAADRIEFEPWMLQTGAELWRLLLELIPRGRSAAGVLMHMARLPAESLELLVQAVIEQPEWARELLAELPGDQPRSDE